MPATHESCKHARQYQFCSHPATKLAVGNPEMLSNLPSYPFFDILDEVFWNLLGIHLSAGRNTGEPKGSTETTISLSLDKLFSSFVIPEIGSAVRKRSEVQLEEDQYVW